MSLESLDFFQKLLIVTVFVLIISWIVVEIIRFRLTLIRRIKISTFTALLFTIITYFFLLGHSFFFKQEAILTERVGEIKGWMIKKEPRLGLYFGIDKKYFDSHFVFLNSSHNITLIDSGNREDSTRIVITDRHQLIHVLNLLLVHRSEFDFAVCDHVFPDSTVKDDSLYVAIKNLQDLNKLIIASYSGLENNRVYNGLDKHYMGDVSIVKNEPVYYSNDLVTINDQDTTYSLSYRMYLRLCDLDDGVEFKDNYVFNNNITELNFKDEGLLFQPKKAKGTSHSPNFYDLGELYKIPVQERFFAKLSEMPARYSKIIFIGNLNDEYVDLHDTSVGQLHGGTLLLNEFYDFYRGHHKMGKLKLIEFILTIYLGYFLILLWILYRADFGDYRKNNNRPPRTKSLNKVISSVLEWGETVLVFIVDELYFLLLLILVVTLDFFFQKLINIVGLIYIFPLFRILLKYAINNKNKEAHL